MKTSLRTFKQISLASLLLLLSFSTAFASDIPAASAYDSLYRYNALENKTSYLELVDNVDGLEESYPAAIDVAQPTEDISKKLQDITAKQNNSIEKVESAMDSINHRNELETFLIGNSLGILRFQLVQIKDQASSLDALALKASDTTTAIQINNQVKSLREEQKKVEDFILEQERKFNLFGWFVNIL